VKRENIMNQNKHTVCNQTGAIIIIVAVSLVMILGFSALSIDFGRRMVVQNQVQNSADAGALAGARFLYNADGTINDTGAKQIATNATNGNDADGSSVTDVTVEIGNWTFANRTFIEISSPTVVSYSGLTDTQIDLRTDIVNAVKVTAKTPRVPNFLAGILGYPDFVAEKNAVAYIGFAGSLLPLEADQPIVICEDTVKVNGVYSCNIGRMANSGNEPQTNDTARWTNFEQTTDSSCPKSANSNDIRDLIKDDCADGGINKHSIAYGNNVGTTNGSVSSAYTKLRDCFLDYIPPRVMNMTLPVVDCSVAPGCGPMVGAINVDVVWMSRSGVGNNPVPIELWSADGSKREWYGGDIVDDDLRWDDFVRHFELQNVNGGYAEFTRSSIYFKPSCVDQPPSGGNNGNNFGTRALIPSLVE
jgi:Flp pilus assembly protein TadG